MKALTILCAVVLGICWAAFAANSVDTINVHVNEPVAVGNVVLPAGNITIRVQRGNPTVLLTFRSESGVTAGAVATRIDDFNDERPDTMLILSRTAAGLKVDRIWLGDHTGLALAQ